MRARQVLVLMSVLILYGALAYTGYQIFLIALTLIILLVIVSLIHLLWMRNRIEVSWFLSKNPVYLGEETALSILVRNRSHWPVAALEVDILQEQGDNIRPSVSRRRILSIFGKGSITEQYDLETEEARLYHVRVSRMRLRDPFDLIRLPVGKQAWRHAEPARLLVFPWPSARIALRSFDQRRLLGLRTSSRHSDEINTVDDIRHMVPGDSLKRIHWIVSAKQNEWMIKTFEKEEQGHVLLVTDLARDQLPESLHRSHRNRVLSLAASIARSFLEGGLSLLLATDSQGPVISKADRDDQLTDLMVQLVMASDRPANPMNRLVEAGLAQLPDNGSVLIVTAYADEALVATSQALIQQGIFVMVVYVRYDQTSIEEQNEWLRRYRNTGAELLVVEQDENKD